jgi:SAM-dependent methyltransferase
MSSTTPEEPNDRTKLRDMFTAPYDKHQSLWSDLWDKGDWLPWDRSYSNPALTDALRTRPDLLGAPIEAPSTQNTVADRGALVGQRRKTALVPGCGRGYDVLLLASLGYDAYGLEVSEKAVEACVRNAADTYDKYKDEQAGEGKSDAGGRYTFIQGDFFKDEWLELSALNDKDFKFDLIYDYTVGAAYEGLPTVADILHSSSVRCRSRQDRHGL